MLLAGVVGCDPAPLGGGGSPGTVATAPVISFLPKSDPADLPSTFWLRIDADADLAPEDLVLVPGEISKARLLQLEHGAPSKTFADEFLPITAFVQGKGILLAPAVPLPPGDYSVGVGKVSWSTSFHVSGRVDGARLVRVWPPPLAPSVPGALVYCLEETGVPSAALDSVALPIRLEPGDLAGRLESYGAGCLRFVPSAPGPKAGSLIPPPVIEIGGTVFVLDPTPLLLTGERAALTKPLVCEAVEFPLLQGCVRIEDDRLLVRTPTDPLDWLFEGDGLSVHRTSAGGATVVGGLSPQSSFALQVRVIDPSGDETTAIFSGTTLAPMPHFLLNEAYANPLGPEPAEEWVELYNDGAAASLAGFVLRDSGGETALPDVVVPAGGFALIVRQDFVASDGEDPVPIDSAVFAIVDAIGKNGLSNSGEQLTLVDPEGKVASKLPATPKPKAGMSVARLHPEDPDLPSSFAVTTPSPGWSNFE